MCAIVCPTNIQQKRAMSLSDPWALLIPEDLKALQLARERFDLLGLRQGGRSLSSNISDDARETSLIYT